MSLFFITIAQDVEKCVGVKEEGLCLSLSARRWNRDFCYDNVPHHPELKTYPHHKHVGDTVVAAGRLIWARYCAKSTGSCSPPDRHLKAKCTTRPVPPVQTYHRPADCHRAGSRPRPAADSRPSWRARPAPSAAPWPSCRGCRALHVRTFQIVNVSTFQRSNGSIRTFRRLLAELPGM